MLIELQGKTSTRLHSATMNKQPQIRLKSLRDVKVAAARKQYNLAKSVVSNRVGLSQLKIDD